MCMPVRIWTIWGDDAAEAPIHAKSTVDQEANRVADRARLPVARSDRPPSVSVRGMKSFLYKEGEDSRLASNVSVHRSVNQFYWTIAVPPVPRRFSLLSPPRSPILYHTLYVVPFLSLSLSLCSTRAIRFHFFQPFFYHSEATTKRSTNVRLVIEIFFAVMFTGRPDISLKIGSTRAP